MTKKQKHKITVYKGSLQSIAGTEAFYENQYMRFFRLKKSKSDYLKYWFSILLFKKDTKKEGKIIPYIDVRTLPGYKDLIKSKGELVLIFFPDKIVPVLFVRALKSGLICAEMFEEWREDTN